MSRSRTVMQILLLFSISQKEECWCDKVNNLQDTPENLHRSFRKNIQLHTAASRGSLDEVQMLLDKGENVNAENGRHETPLHFAVVANSVDVVEKLLQYQAEVNAADYMGYTPLHKAAFFCLPEVTKILLSYGADLNVKEERQKTPLRFATSMRCLEVMEILLQNGANPSITDELGNTPLHYSNFGSYKDVEVLLKYGANVNIQNLVGVSPLHDAIDEGSVRSVELLLEAGANVNAVSINGQTPLHLAAAKGNVEIVELLLDFNANANVYGVDIARFLKRFNYFGELSEEELPLIALSYTAQKAMKLVKLLQQYDRINKKNTPMKMGFSPLSLAVYFKRVGVISVLTKRVNTTDILNPSNAEWPPLHVAAYFGIDRMTEYLLENGANLEIKDGLDFTALHKAAMMGNMESVEILLELNIDVNAVGVYGWTPVMLAAKYNHNEITRMIIRYGGDAGLEDFGGFTALMWAEAGGHPMFLDLLVEKTIELTSNNRYDYRKKMSYSTFGNHKVTWGKSVVLYLESSFETSESIQIQNYLDSIASDVYFDSEHFYELLYKYSIGIYEPDEKITYLDVSSFMNYTLMYLRNNHFDTMSVILDSDPWCVNKQDRKMGWSALHWAAATGDIDTVKLLVSKGARLNLKSKLGHTPLFMARYWGHTKLYNFLKSLGAVWHFHGPRWEWLL